MEKLKSLNTARHIYHSHLKICQNEAPAILKQIRKKHKWLQYDLAKKLDCTASYICHIEAGRMIASSKLLIKLLEIMGKTNENY